MTRLRRRALLAHAGLWSLLWPVLRHREAGAQSELTPRRVLILFSGNGPIMERGPAVGTEHDFQLHPWWAPLERHRDRGFFFAGMHQAGVPFGEHDEYGHQSAGTGALTARTTEKTNNATGPSLDQFIGQELQRAGVVTPYRSLLWGLQGNVGRWGPWYEAAGKPVSPIVNPWDALGDLLPSLGTETEPNPELVRKHLILEQVYRDCQPLRRDLGTEGRAILDAHCENIESLERAVSEALTGPRCEAPAGPGTALPSDTNFDRPEHRDEAMKAFRSLMSLAFSCDLTRVIGFSFNKTAARFALPESYGVPSAAQVDSGDSGPQHHAWTHIYEDSADKRTALRTFTQWYAEQVALILDDLTTTIDATGRPLIDSTLVLWTSELGHNENNPLGPHPNRNIPVMLFGDGLGELTPGRFYDGDNSPQTALDLHALFVSVIRHAGLDAVDTFGNAGTGPLDWLAG